MYLFVPYIQPVVLTQPGSFAPAELELVFLWTVPDVLGNHERALLLRTTLCPHCSTSFAANAP